MSVISGIVRALMAITPETTITYKALADDKAHGLIEQSINATTKEDKLAAQQQLYFSTELFYQFGKNYSVTVRDDARALDPKGRTYQFNAEQLQTLMEHSATSPEAHALVKTLVKSMAAFGATFNGHSVHTDYFQIGAGVFFHVDSGKVYSATSLRREIAEGDAISMKIASMHTTAQFEDGDDRFSILDNGTVFVHGSQVDGAGAHLVSITDALTLSENLELKAAFFSNQLAHDPTDGNFDAAFAFISKSTDMTPQLIALRETVLTHIMEKEMASVDSASTSSRTLESTTAPSSAGTSVAEGIRGKPAATDQRAFGMSLTNRV